jgi:hypothetical protein
MTVDLTLLRPGVKVRLRGDAKPQPRKPYPRGWREIADTNGKPSMQRLATVFKVVSDDRWMPVELIEEIRP